MAIVICGNMHYFDNSKNEQCPYCVKLQSGETIDKNDIQEQQTVYKDIYSNSDQGQKTEAYGEAIDEGDKTIGFYSDETGNSFTVGWLVCTNGPVKGKSYSLHSGRNFAGRSLDMDVVLSDDLTISREKHFSIVYDPKSNLYFLLAGSGNTFLNGQPMTEDKEIFEGDCITAGASEYTFIPFCKEGRKW